MIDNQITENGIATFSNRILRCLDLMNFSIGGNLLKDEWGSTFLSSLLHLKSLELLDLSCMIILILLLFYYLIDCGLSTESSEIITNNMFTVLTHLKQLELSGNTIDPKDKKQFIENISNLKELESLSLAEMNLPFSDVYELFISVSSIDSVQSINLCCIYFISQFNN